MVYLDGSTGRSGSNPRSIGSKINPKGEGKGAADNDDFDEGPSRASDR